MDEAVRRNACYLLNRTRRPPVASFKSRENDPRAALLPGHLNMFGNFIPKAKAFTRVAQKPPSSHVRTVSSQSDESLAGGHHHEVRRQMWVPPMLHSMTFVAFAFLFIVFIIVIEVLYVVSNRNEGLSSSQEKYHYLWTYGPTAGKSLRSLYTPDEPILILL